MTIFGINLSRTDLWMLGICGALITSWICYCLAISLNRRNSFNNAAKEFTDTICRELQDIYPIPAKWPDDIDTFLRSKFTNLQSAVEKFKFFLPWHKRRSIEKDWFRFYCSTGRKVDKNCQVYHHYMPFRGSSSDGGKIKEYDNTKTNKENFKHNVDKLLLYAKQK